MNRSEGKLSMACKHGLFAALIALSGLVAQSAVAAGCTSSICEDVPILALWVKPDYIYVKVDASTTAFTCSLYGGSGGYAAIPYTGPYKEFYATLLANQLADHPVSFNIAPGTGLCTITSVYVNTP